MTRNQGSDPDEGRVPTAEELAADDAFIDRNRAAARAALTDDEEV